MSKFLDIIRTALVRVLGYIFGSILSISQSVSLYTVVSCCFIPTQDLLSSRIPNSLEQPHAIPYPAA